MNDTTTVDLQENEIELKDIPMEEEISQQQSGIAEVSDE